MKRMLLFFATLWLGIMGASAQRYHYDVNNDGGVNVNDAVAVVNKILGKDNPGEGAAGEAIDLGLLSGTLWSSCNVGAFNPEEYGNYYAWGETKTKDTYSLDNYQYYQNGSYMDIGMDICGTKYDVAHQEWGGKWVMPNEDDFNELLDNCTKEWTTLNGVNGLKFISKINGNSIFLPHAGYREGDLYNAGTYGLYWLSNQNPEYLNLLLFFEQVSSTPNRFFGLSVRPVIKTKQAIDLGLPSGTKWANCNVGASSPEEYGEYFAWGELGEKKEYTKENYQFYVNNEYMNLGDISGTKYDVAHQRWGGNWCMPTYDDIEELLDNCTNEWTTLNGVNGWKFTSNINGNSIFMPAAGYRDASHFYAVYADGGLGSYRSSTQNPSYASNTYGLDFSPSYTICISYNDRLHGQSVRPVYKN